MELLTCPACGCSVQVADALLGQHVRCFGCQRSFLAVADQAAPQSARRDASILPPFARPPHSQDEDAALDERGPFCPGCGRRISWRDGVCRHCGEELEAEDGAWSAGRRMADLVRRDYEPHHGTLILALGNISMIVGGLSLCSLGFGALVSIPVGIIAWVLANHDLERMRQGYMDPRGKSQTQTGRTGAIAGIILGVIFAAFYSLIYLAG